MNNLSGQDKFKLMVGGHIATDATNSALVTVRRGMPMVACDGMEVGKVAAVALSGEGETVTHLLLGRLPERDGYWLVSLDLITRAEEGKIQLAVHAEAVEQLPRWRGG